MIRCSTCHQGTMTSGYVQNHDVSKLFAFDEPVVLERAPALVCDRCGAVMLEGPVVEGAEDALAKLLVEGGRELWPKEVRFLRSMLGMTQAALAERLGTDRTTVARWEIGETRLGTLQSLAVRSLVAWHLVEKHPSLASELAERFIRSPAANIEPPYRLEGIAA